MIRTIPNINTARLTLRGMRPEDFDRFAEIWAMPDVVRFVGGAPWSRGRAWNSFLRNAGHWQMTGFGQWAIVEQGSREIIGQTGFFYSDRSLGGDFDAFPEAGWILDPHYHGRGYGPEAAQAAHDWLDRVNPNRLVAMITPDNDASLRLAHGLNYQLVRETQFDGEDVVLFRRDGP